MLDCTQVKNSNVARTVLGPVPSQELGVVLIHESLFSVVPGQNWLRK